ncbi:hypothetical protein ACHAW5_002805 [Stephanodiscus triporus]|uniref:J domain-containing protein n=1 Tax=Stephanodiscus triporus TaxID=2934178 RepID=A0ABD3Q572_9STRA
MMEGDALCHRFDGEESACYRLDSNDDDCRIHDRTYDGATTAQYPEQRDDCHYFDHVATWREESESIVVEEGEWEAEEDAVERMDRERERERRNVEEAREEAARAYRMAAASEEGAALAADRSRREGEKEAIERELARQVADTYRRQIESRRNGGRPSSSSSSSSIARSRWIPKLPDTNDPLELLGLDRRSPPQNAEDVRRAFLRMAKKYHPDAVAADATPEQREKASINFARINAAYQLLKDKRERLGDEYFATTLGGPMYEPRNNNRYRQSFYRGHDDEDYGSVFSGHAYSARYGHSHGTYQQQPRSQVGNHRNHPHHGESRKSPFHRRYRQEVGDNCHVSGKQFPPFFNN